MLKLDNFIVIEGMCQSGKTTLARRLVDELSQQEHTVFYNHGALTYTTVGRAFTEVIDEMSIALSTSYYLADLVQDSTRNLLPKLQANQVVIQDRYAKSIITYRRAFSQLTGDYLEIQPVVDLYLELELLIQPKLELFCLPPLDVIRGRMEKARETTVHRFYLDNPDFLELVYNQNRQSAVTSEHAICVDTTNPLNVDRAIDKVKALVC
jgi:thymidylate kinase